jgi:transglutaminase-like putative cysteine protease
MRLNILHRTRYRYSHPVSENFNEVRLQPVSDEVQECHGFVLTTSPTARIQRYHDFHLNLVDHFYVNEPHEGLVVEARSEVTTHPRTAPAPGAAGFPMSRVSEYLRMERCYDFLQASTYVELDVEVWRLARDAAGTGEEAWSVAVSMMEFVYRTFRYDPSATTVQTGLREVLRLRRGVCQDFAHVLLGLCRSVGIPARYVSGYLYVGQDASLRGDLASHAWVEVYLPEQGWLALDPTNNRLADPHHVKVAVGRDYADAAPLRGTFKGRATQEMSVDLQITCLDDLDGAASDGSPGMPTEPGLAGHGGLVQTARDGTF